MYIKNKYIYKYILSFKIILKYIITIKLLLKYQCIFKIEYIYIYICIYIYISMSIYIYLFNFFSFFFFFYSDVVCIKEDCMIWFDKDKLTLNFVEFAQPEDVREFHVGSNILMVDIIDNLIICLNSEYIIILFSRSKLHKKWHVRLVNEPGHENGQLFIINSCILDNMFTISFFELLPQAQENEEGEEGEAQENQGEFKIYVWDLSVLVEALKYENVDEKYYYEINVNHLIIPVNFNPYIVHNCIIEEKNKETGELEKNYLIMSCTSNDGIITIFSFDDNLRSKAVTNYKYDLEDDILLWASVHKDGTILAIGKKEIEIFSLNQTEIEQHRKISADVFNSFNLYDIVSIIF